MKKNNSNITIAFVIWTLEGMSGSEKVVYDIVRKLDNKRYNKILIGLTEGPIRKLYEDLGVKVVAVSGNNRIGCIKNLRATLLKEKVDIVNAHHFLPLLYSFLATRNTNIKFVHTEHSRWQLEQLKLVKKVLNKIFLKKSDAIIAISEQIEDYYLNNLSINDGKVYLIPNGIDLKIIEKGRAGSIIKELDIKPEEKIIGMVATIRTEKNHKLLISAFSRVAKEINNIRLILAGMDFTGGETSEIVAKSDAADKIYYLGHRNDVPDLLSVFDIFCLTSTNEGMPLVVLEAMAAGVPVIGSDVLGINEVITNNVNGLLFPNNDEEKLAETMKRLLKDHNLRTRLSQAGRTTVKDNYSLDDKINEYDRLFRSLLA